MPEITDPILLILSVLGYWALVLGTLEVQIHIQYVAQDFLPGAPDVEQPPFHLRREVVAIVGKFRQIRFRSNPKVGDIHISTYLYM